MANAVNEAVWQQYGGAIAMLDNALEACPDELWTGTVWEAEPDPEEPVTINEVWSGAAHALRWLERYLLAVPEEDFASLETAALRLGGEPLPKAEVRAALSALRERCRTTLAGLGEEDLARPILYEWIGTPISYLELQLYNIRHVQEHAAQLNLFLGRRGVPDAALDWVSRADP